MYPRVTSETEYLALFHSISQLTHPLGRSVYLTINPSSSSQVCTQASIQKSTVCGSSFGLPVLRRRDIMLNWQTHFSIVKHQIQYMYMQRFVGFSLYWEFNSWFHWRVIFVHSKSQDDCCFFTVCPDERHCVCCSSELCSGRVCRSSCAVGERADLHPVQPLILDEWSTLPTAWLPPSNLANTHNKW